MSFARTLRAALVCLAAAASPLAAKDPPPMQAGNRDPRADELRELRGRIEKLQREISTAEKSRGDASEELRASDKAVSEAHRALFTLRQHRESLDAALEAIARRRAALGESVSSQQALAERLLRLQYQHGGLDRLRLLAEGRDAATVARHAAYYGYIQKERAAAIAELRDKAQRLEELDREARARRDEIAANEEAQEREARVLERERLARAATVRRIAADIEKGRREIGRLQRDEARLARLVEEITRALAAKPAPKPAPSVRRVERVADASLGGKPFESLKGRLRLPVRGELVNQYGAARDASGVQWKGLFIRSATGETVHAIADGRVVYADWLRGFGNLLILDHGGGFMSLYANNEGLLRQVGEKVRSGEPVASVGASGSHEETGLYFELRRDGRPFDPMKWIAL